jgi:hypothetical protein
MQTIKLRDARFPANSWLRRCQECGNVQAMKSPINYKNDSWRDLECKKCKSESLDYGTQHEYVDYGEDD